MSAPSSVTSAAAPPQAAASATGETFGSAEEAVTTLADALRAGQADVVQSVLGPGSENLLSSGDKYSDAAERQRFLGAYDEKHKLISPEQGHMILQVGNDDWPFPIPLVEAGGRWHFDRKPALRNSSIAGSGAMRLLQSAPRSLT